MQKHLHSVIDHQSQHHAFSLFVGLALPLKRSLNPAIHPIYVPYIYMPTLHSPLHPHKGLPLAFQVSKVKLHNPFKTYRPDTYLQSFRFFFWLQYWQLIASAARHMYIELQAMPKAHIAPCRASVTLFTRPSHDISCFYLYPCSSLTLSSLARHAPVHSSHFSTRIHLQHYAQLWNHNS